MAKINNEGSFSISVVGEKTKTTHTGDFKATIVLSYNAESLKGRLYREALGEFPQHATPRQRDLAEFYSDFDVSLTETPLWWKSANNGRQFYGDDNVILEVYEALQALRLDPKAKEDAEKDKEKVEKVLEGAK